MSSCRRFKRASAARLRAAAIRALCRAAILSTRSAPCCLRSRSIQRLEIPGAPTPMIENVQRGVRGSAGQGGSANYDVSSNGTLVYVPDFALVAGVPRRLLAVDLSGNSVPLIDDERDFWRPRISPGGGRVAVEVLQPNYSPQVWIVDLAHRTLNPVGSSETSYPAWTPDGKSVIYRRGEGQFVRQPTDGGSGAQVLVDSPGSTFRVMDSRAMGSWQSRRAVHRTTFRPFISALV